MPSSSAMSTPFFSVLIPSYNRPEYIKICIESVLGNDFSDYEILVSDDKSPRIQEILSVVSPYVKANQLRFVSQPHNLGWSDNRNYLVSNARGKYVILMGDDDKLFPYSLTRLKHYIDAYPGYDVYPFGFTVIDHNDDCRYARVSPKVLEISLDSPLVAKSLLVSGVLPFWVFHPFTMCYLREVSLDIVYQKSAHIGDDLLFMVDCLDAGKKMCVIPEQLFCWRKVPEMKGAAYQNLSSSGKNNLIARKNILEILEARSNMSEICAKYVNSQEFRRRFLYDSIVSDSAISEADIISLRLKDSHLAELRSMISSAVPWAHRIRIRLEQFMEYFGLFGLSGIRMLLTMHFRFQATTSTRKV